MKNNAVEYMRVVVAAIQLMMMVMYSGVIILIVEKVHAFAAWV